jgi:hypothetical protein
MRLRFKVIPKCRSTINRSTKVSVITGILHLSGIDVDLPSYEHVLPTSFIDTNRCLGDLEEIISNRLLH